MKTIAFLILGAALCALPAFPQEGAAAASSPPAPAVHPSAFAQPGDWSFEGLGGVNASAVDRESNASGSAGVQAAYGIGHKLAVTGSFLFDDIDKIGSVSVNAKEFNIGLLRSFAQKGRVEPYFRFDAGGMHQGWLEVNHLLVPGSTQVTVSPGFGFLLAVNRVIALDFAVRAVVPAQSNPLPWQIQALVGVAFRLPHSGR
jgi:hypothetical protein